MKRSTDRILTTHAGSLPRPPEVLSFVLGQRQPTDAEDMDSEVRTAVKQIVEKQADVGLDVVNDGEESKPSYSTYVADRMNGFGVVESWKGRGIPLRSRDFEEFPDFTAMFRATAFGGGSPTRGSESAPRETASLAAVGSVACVGPVSYNGLEAVEKDIENLKAAVGGVEVEDAFMSAVSPGTIDMFFPNTYYADDRAYLEDVALAMRAEYEAIHQAGITLQLDCPDLAVPGAGMPLEDFRRDIELRIEMLNHAVANIPAEAMRIHVCWGNWAIPRKNDVPLVDIVDILLKAKPAGLMLMAANGAHAHEWKVFEDVKLPDGKYLIAGVLDSTTNIIEHPEVVADRLIRFAGVVGKENVMAGTDCGFATGAAGGAVVPSVVWAKFQAQAAGAALASSELW